MPVPKARRIGETVLLPWSSSLGKEGLRGEASKEGWQAISGPSTVQGQAMETVFISQTVLRAFGKGGLAVPTAMDIGNVSLFQAGKRTSRLSGFITLEAFT